MAPEGENSASRERVDAVFAREQLRSNRLALRVILVVLPLITVWITIENGFHGASFFYPYLALIGLLLTVPYLLRRAGYAVPWIEYALSPVFAALVTYLSVTSPPNDSLRLPLPLHLTFGNEVYLFVLLGASVFTFRPAVVMWTGVVTAAAWSVVTVRALLQPESFGDISEEVWWTLTAEQQIRAISDPHRVHIAKWVRQVVGLLVVAGSLATFVRLCRGLVLRQAMVERERANLSRYFSPNLVEELARTDEPLGPTRSQSVAVLFADMIGFTAMSEQRRPEDVIALLREFHGRMQHAVFAHEGTVDKYIGDAVMATFGTPTTRADDALRALRCAGAMVQSVEEWNTQRQKRGEPAVQIGVGIHYGPVVLGDIGGEQRLEFAVIGDTVNVASRLERLTRELRARVVVSDEVVSAVRREVGEVPEVAALAPAGEHTLRGRDTPVMVWSLS